MKLLYVNNKNAKIFQDQVKKQDAFVKYFSPTCPACIAMEDEWDDMCKDIDEKYNTDLILAQMDPTGMKELESTDVHTDVEFVPTIVILKNGKKHKEYNGNKNKEDMIKYLLDEKLIHPKMKGGSKTLKNTKNKKCSGNNFTNCCPHMPVNAKGEYTATTKSRPHILNLDGNKYRFYTCCMACKEAMTKLARENPKKFKSVYVKSIKGDKIYFKHKDTGKMVQIGTKIKSKTRKGGASARNILLKQS
jgi:thiol-disulfide isomerase/thioredoxin